MSATCKRNGEFRRISLIPPHPRLNKICLKLALLTELQVNKKPPQLGGFFIFGRQKAFIKKCARSFLKKNIFWKWRPKIFIFYNICFPSFFSAFFQSLRATYLSLIVQKAISRQFKFPIFSRHFFTFFINSDLSEKLRPRPF